MENNQKKTENTFERGAKAVGHGLTRIIKTPANAIVYGANMIVSEPGEQQAKEKEEQKMTIGQGMFGLGKGIVMGVAGIVGDPIKGAQYGGFSGFVKGVGSGVVGVVSKPVKGVVDLMESVDQTIDGTNRSGKRSTLGKRDYFSAPLADQINFNGKGKLPIIMYKCIEQLQIRGMEEEGLFRIGGKFAVVQELRKNLAAGMEISYDNLDVADVASLFKLWLRELPTPLIPFAHYPEVINLWKTWKEQYSVEEKRQWRIKLRNIIKSIREPELRCLAQVILFLSKVAKHSSKNKMTPKNLATCLAPNLLYEECKEGALLANAYSQAGDTHLTIETIRELIEDVEFYFFEDWKIEVKDTSDETGENSVSCKLKNSGTEEKVAIMKIERGPVRRNCPPQKTKMDHGKISRRKPVPPPPPKKDSSKHNGARRVQRSTGKITDL